MMKPLTILLFTATIFSVFLTVSCDDQTNKIYRKLDGEWTVINYTKTTYTNGAITWDTTINNAGAFAFSHSGGRLGYSFNNCNYSIAEGVPIVATRELSQFNVPVWGGDCYYKVYNDDDRLVLLTENSLLEAFALSLTMSDFSRNKMTWYYTALQQDTSGAPIEIIEKFELRKN
ncbi:MAG: hypothetical protein KDC92_02885 [Bacteroidetes bacterium]|nr:hypothetical protein [Bacteroidota bacterium]